MLRFAGPIVMVLMMVIPAAVGADDMVMQLSSESSVIRGGDDVILDLCLENTTDAAKAYELPLSLPCRMVVNHSIVRLPAQLLDADGPIDMDIPAEEIVCRQYRLTISLFNPDGYLAGKVPWASRFHFGYTQRSIWDLKDDSKPFDDTSYMPELFYLVPKIDLHIRKISAFGIQGGFLHESNGKGGDDSRSTNILYVKPVMGIHLMGPWYLKIAPNAHIYVNNSKRGNRDLMDYRGYVDMDIGIASPDGAALNSHWWWAKKGSTVQLDFTYPMTGLFGKSLNFYLQAQYFSGYAETLLHYKERHDAIRIGFGIVR